MIARAQLVALLALSCTAGCKERGKSGNKQAAPKAPGAIPAVGSAPSSDLALLPVDAELVLSLDWKQLQTTPLWRKHALPAIMKQRAVVAVVAEIKARCGIDVAADITRVTVGFKGIERKAPEGVMVFRGLDKTKALACPEKFNAEAAEEELILQHDGDVVLGTDRDGDQLGLVFRDDRALVLIGRNLTFDRVRQAGSRTVSLATSRAFAQMQAKVDVKATVWGLVRGTAMQSAMEDEISAKPTAVYGSVALGDVATAVVRARFPSDELAKQTAESLRAQAGTVPFDHVSLAASGSDVVLEVHASAATLDAFATLLKSSI